VRVRVRVSSHTRESVLVRTAIEQAVPLAAVAWVRGRGRGI